MTDIELPEPYGYLREQDGGLQMSIGPARPADRSGGYATPWAAMYDASRVRQATAAKDAEIAELQAKLKQAHKDYGCELADPNGTIWDHAANLQREVEALRKALRDLLDDTQHKNHNCGDEGCPVANARALLRDQEQNHE